MFCYKYFCFGFMFIDICGCILFGFFILLIFYVIIMKVFWIVVILFEIMKYFVVFVFFVLVYVGECNLKKIYLKDLL